MGSLPQETGRGPSLSRNAGSNLAGLFVYLVVAFFLSPFIIRTLGDARYGAWSLVAELIGYYGLLDFGLRVAVSYFVAHYVARADHQRMGQSVCSAFWTLLPVGMGLAVAGTGLALVFPRLFVKGQIDSGEVVAAMMIMSATIGLALPMEVFSAVLTGYRRIDLVNVVEVVSRLLVAGGIYAALTAGHGLVWMSLIQCGGRVLTWSVAYVQAQRVSGGFSLRPRNFRRTELRKLTGLGAINLVLNLAEVVSSRTDLVVIGVFLGVKWVAYYNIGRMLVEYASQINFSLTGAFRPHLTHLYSQGDLEGVRRMFLLGARVSTVLALPLAACMFVFGRPFLALWVGEAYVAGAPGERSDVIMMLLLLGHAVRWPQSITWQLVFATGKYRFLTFVRVIQGVATVALSVALVRLWGLIGVALAVVVPMVAVNLIVVPANALRRFQIRPADYLRQGIGRPVLTALVVFAAAQVLVHAWYPTSWRVFLAEAAAVVAIQGCVTWTVGLTRGDRTLALKRAAAALQVLGKGKQT